MDNKEKDLLNQSNDNNTAVENSKVEEVSLNEFDTNEAIEVEADNTDKIEDSEDKTEENKSPSKDKKTKKVKTKKERKILKHSAMASILTIVFVVVLVLVNIVATKVFDRFPLTVDLSGNSSYSISDKTEEYIKGIKQDVKVTVFATEKAFTSGSTFTLQANEILKKYAQTNSKIEIEYVDYDSNPDIVASFDDTTIASYDIVFSTTSKDDDGKEVIRSSVVKPLDLVNFNATLTSQLSQQGYTLEIVAQQYGSQMALISSSEDLTFDDTQTGEKQRYIESSNAEQAFTSALLSVTDENQISVSVLTGRGEATPLTYLQTLLKANGYNVNTIDVTTADIPSTTDLIIMPAPTIDYTEAEIKKVSDFLSNDGKLKKNLLYVQSVQQQETPNIAQFLAEWGIEYDTANFVYDSNEDNVSNYYLYVDRTMPTDGYDIKLKNDDLKMMTSIYTRPMKTLFEEQGNRICYPYLQTAETGYSMDKDNNEVDKGEIATGVIASEVVYVGNTGKDYSNVLALGSEYFLNDSILQSTQYANRDWIISTLNTLTNKTSTGITIEPKLVDNNIFELTNAKITVLKIIFIGVIPAIVVVLGIIVWLRRKNR